MAIKIYQKDNSEKLPPSFICPDCGKFKGDRNSASRGRCKACKFLSLERLGPPLVVTREEMRAYERRQMEKIKEYCARRRS